MTREEAIAILEVSKHMATSGRMYNQAIDMAIEALSAQTDAELISRADALKAIEKEEKRIERDIEDAKENPDKYTDNFISAEEERVNGLADAYIIIDGISEAIATVDDLPSAEQVISKLKKPCDSLLTDESNGSKEHKSKLDLISRADVIEAVAKLDRYDVDERNRLRAYTPFHGAETQTFIDVVDLYQALEVLPSADAIHSVGVFVPNMEMPKVCDYCLFHDSEWSWCKAKDKYCGDGKCPLIAVRGERREP